MDIDAVILQFIKKVRKRICSDITGKAIILGIAVGFLIWGIFNFIALFVPFYGAVWYGLAAGIVVGILIPILSPIRYPSIKETGHKIDNLGLKERVTTSLYLSGRHDDMSMLQKNNTLSFIQKVNVKKAFPRKLNKKLLLFLLATFLFATVTWVIPAKAKEDAEINHMFEEQVKEKQEEIEEIVENIKENYELSDEEIALLDEMA
nr:hypothetical protein [Lachnospiraceae bacterium]